MTSSDPDFDRYSELFLGDANLAGTIVVLCKHNVVPGIDPISQVVSVILSVPFELHLVSNGLHMFKGKDLLYPYQQMNAEQREFLLGLLAKPDSNWHRYEHSMVWKQKGPCNNKPKPVQVLETVCRLVQNNKKLKDEQSKLVICNVILQRVQSHVPIHKDVQLQLNQLLFGDLKDTVAIQPQQEDGSFPME